MINQVYYTFLLSQVFGLFMFILAAIVMGRMQFYRKMILQLKANNPAIAMCSILALFLGIVLVVTHSVWSTRSMIWITSFSWFMFMMSILWLAVPEKMLGYTKRVCSGIGYYWIIVALLIFGAIVIGRGAQLFIAIHSAPVVAPY